MNKEITHRLAVQLKNNPTPRTLGKMPEGIDFSSNDYLGLARIKSAPDVPSGSTGSRLLTGHSTLAEDAECMLANDFGYSDCLIFPSGYMANVGILSSIPERGSLILYDQYAHSCIKDGARLGLGARQSFRHNDLEDLEKKISRHKGMCYVVVESIYSMDGDESPLKELSGLTNHYSAALVVDEAHATGVRGANGGGLCEELKLQQEMLAVIYTFGKGMGTHGAAIASDKIVKDYLINFSRQFIYTTGLPPATYAHLLSIRNLIRENSQPRQALKNNISYFLDCWQKNAPGELGRINSTSHIQAIICPGNDQARQLAANIRQDGFDVRPILSPTVPEGTERIRICLHAFNTFSEIDGLIQSISANFQE